jgi:hypothetical protein
MLRRTISTVFADKEVEYRPSPGATAPERSARR